MSVDLGRDVDLSGRKNTELLDLLSRREMYTFLYS
jgi:hypothetical protein